MGTANCKKRTRETTMENISYDDFLKVDVRVGTILSVEAVPKSKKLLKLTVSFGEQLGTRTIMAGIANATQYGAVVDGVWKDSCLVGTRSLFVVNLAPRTMMGVESHGMILAAHEDANGELWLTSIGPIPDGARIG
jgi:methionyl-tRNA synthetase